MPYTVSVERVAPRAIAAVRGRMPITQVRSRFREFLDLVYDARKNGAVKLDGQNVFLYTVDASGTADVAFGVGVTEPFAPVGRVELVEVPGGEIATATHWGDYAGLGSAHETVIAWCNNEGRARAGIFWEVYGHWNDDWAKVRTDVCYLLKS